MVIVEITDNKNGTKKRIQLSGIDFSVKVMNEVNIKDLPMEQKGGTHYSKFVPSIKSIIESWGLDPTQADAIEYVLRCFLKENPELDLEKAKTNIDRLLTKIKSDKEDGEKN